MQQNCLKKQSDSEFICKLCDMIEKYPTIINWDSQGQKMIIFDIDKMETLVLPQYFRHSNFPSFIRQLNMYNFHKLYKQDKEIAFQNQIFKKGNQKNYHFIQRKKKIKEQELVSIQFQKKNQHILKKIKKQPNISFQIKSIIQGLLEYKYTIVENMKKMRLELQTVYKQLKDCRSKKISEATKEIKNKILEQMNEQIKLSRQIDRHMETSFLQQKQHKQMMINHINSQYYLPVFTDDKNTIKDLFFDCNRIRSRPSFVAYPSHCAFFSMNSNSQQIFFSSPKIPDPNQAQKTITKQQEVDDDFESLSMQMVGQQQLEQIMNQKQNQKFRENKEHPNLKREAN